MKPEDLVLDTGGPVDGASLAFRPGQCVRGHSGRRALVVAPAGGVTVDRENVRFENIDFLWRETSNANDPATAPAIVQLLAGQAEFRGCSFRCESSAAKSVPAVRWTHPVGRDQADVSLPNGRIVLIDCFFRHVATGLDCYTMGTLAIDMKNVLHLAAGPLVRLDHCPQADEPMSIVLDQVTLRDSGPMMECRVAGFERQPGEIAIYATACAFAPEPGAPLVRLTGEAMPQGFEAALRWSGQGSLVLPQAAMVAWRNLNGNEEMIDETSLSIAGLVRSGVEFAGRASGNPAASRLVRWQAPLQSSDPPGIDPSPLPTGGEVKKNSREQTAPGM